MSDWAWVSGTIAGVLVAAVLAGRWWLDRRRGAVNYPALIRNSLGGLVGLLLFVALVLVAERR